MQATGGMRLDELNPAESAPECQKPALFIHGIDDNFIVMQNTETVMEAYSGEKDVSYCPGDHNAERPQETLDAVKEHFRKHLL